MSVIDIARLSTAAASTIKPGQYYIGVNHEGRHPMIGALWESSNVIVDLQTMTKCLPSESPYPLGYTVPQIRIEVDETSALPANQNRPSGSIILMNRRVAIYLTAKPGERYVFAIDEAVRLPRDVADGDIVFPSWHIVCGPEDRPIELFDPSMAGAPVEGV